MAGVSHVSGDSRVSAVSEASRGDEDVTIRRAQEDDRDFLIRMNHLTETWGDEDAAQERDFSESDCHYVGKWTPDQGGVIVVQDGEPIGAAWLRTFTAEDPGTGFVEEKYPEVAIALAPGHTGEGLGRRLLTAALDQARDDGRPGVSLCVEKGNDRAQALYEKLGFRYVTTRESEGSTYMVMVHTYE